MNEDIKVVDNLLPDGYVEALRQDMTGADFPWVYIDNVTHAGSKGSPGFGHTVLDVPNQIRSAWLPFFKPLVYHIEAANGVPITELIRIRVGLLLPSDGKTNEPHIDFTFPHYTACYYVEDTEGPTVIYDQRSDGSMNYIQAREMAEQGNFTIACANHPKRNSAVIFDGLRFHASSYPITNKRIVITVNYR